MSAGRIVPAVLAVWLAALPPAMAGGAHEHGIAHLDVGVDDGGVVITLDTPLEALVGFEHAPRDARQRDALARMVDRLKSADRMFALDPAAGCRLDAATVEHPFEASKGGAAEAPAGGHADAQASWAWRCERPAALKRIEVRLFNDFPGLKTLRVQTATLKGQGSATLVKSKRVLSF